MPSRITNPSLRFFVLAALAAIPAAFGRPVVQAVIASPPRTVVLETEGAASGAFIYENADGTTIRIRKVLGGLGEQPPPVRIVRYPKAFWARLLKAKNDILAEKLLSGSRSDPTFRQIQGLYPRLAKAEACIGRMEDASGITVAIDGSVSMGSPYFSGSRRLGDQVYSP
ncbi:MAG: hypothetical protein ACREFX_13165, partial [Opitutaceae bacterium]